MRDELIYKTNTDEPTLKNVDTESYRGVKLEVSDGKGNIIESSDTRELAAEKKKKLAEFKKVGFEEAASNMPITEQMNTILGFIAGVFTKQDVINRLRSVQDIKDKYAAKKAEVMAATTFEELEEVIW